MPGNRQNIAAASGTRTTAAAFLRGAWRVHRRIVDHRLDVAGEFRGSASFEDDDAGDLIYTERGELRFGGHRGPATRSLRYRVRGDAVLDVRFADGRDFYRLEVSGGRWHATHPCRADLYTVTGAITGPDGFTEHWHTTGPATDYDLFTDYTRRTGPRPFRRPGTSTVPEL
jgi:hypothetical protein